ncbi:ferritin-like domain-containing protein [Sphingomonas sp. SRS2]|uniref:ferritin-like domain-containing protein n=1 Tax=Sphingomonas sp. SRS2 TaxID=133190 RepID=UPI0006184CAD|nr:PA2169 family four-helix-bundle protein [Sphingomonas sp. SRS2]KKC24796.1 hypothetical protein WP12_17555 [Sphingomonas sp. SRS2]
MDNDTDISVLNSLIKTTIDSVKGFEDAAEDSEGGRFESLFSEFASERRAVVATLQDEVRRLGGNPEDDSSFAAAAHRTFMNLKQAFSARDDEAVVNEVERGEDFLKEKYEAALRGDDVSPQTRTIIERAFVSVREGHDRASALKHSLANEA